MTLHGPTPVRAADERRVAAYGYRGLAITELAHHHRVTLQLHGELDLANAELLSLAVARAGIVGCASLVLDVSGLEFCDCAGLRAIARAHDDKCAVGAELVLRGVTARIRRLLRIAGLDTVLHIDDTDPLPPSRLRLATQNGRTVT